MRGCRAGVGVGVARNTLAVFTRELFLSLVLGVVLVEVPGLFWGVGEADVRLVGDRAEFG